MKISVYSLKDVEMSLGIVQFEEDELGIVRKILENLDIEEIAKKFKSIGIDVVELTKAIGIRVRGSWSGNVLYISVHGEGERIWIEVLDEFLDFIANLDVLKAVEVITSFIRNIYPGIRIRHRKMMVI